MSHDTDTPRDASTGRRPIAVLLVDDQPFVGVALKRLLAAEADIEVHCCHAAVEAVARAQQVRPTLILQDLVMPGIDGLTLVASYRSDPVMARVPVVVLSGNDGDDTRAQALAAGATDYLVKLPSRGDLIACIRRHGSSQPSASPASVEVQSADDTDANCTLDPSVMAELRAASEDFTMDLVDLFIEDAEARVALLRTAAGRDDANELQATAHCLKGSAMTMGARRLAVLCGRLEAHAKDSCDRNTTTTLVAGIGEELGEVCKALMREPQGLQATSPGSGDARV